jgi:hypothetical protein
MLKNDMPTSGVSEDVLISSGVNDGDNEEENNDNQFDDSNDDSNDDDGEDDDNQNQNNNQKKPVDWKHKFHATVTSQNRTIAQLKSEIAEIR